MMFDTVPQSWCQFPALRIVIGPLKGRTSFYIVRSRQSSPSSALYLSVPSGRWRRLSASDYVERCPAF